MGVSFTVSSEPTESGAGASAYAVAEQRELEIAAVESQVLGLLEYLQRLRKDRDQWQAGGDGEARVARVLVDMIDTGWHVLADRAWPGTRRANIDLIVVGPGGVFVIDVKNWRDVRVEAGRLWRGDEPQDGTIDKLLDQSAAVENVLVELGLPPAEVVPMLALAHRRNAGAALGRVTVCGERNLPRDLLRRGIRLGPSQVTAIVAALQDACPPRASHRCPASRRAVPVAVKPDAQLALLSADDLLTALREAACAEPIESWMVWLDPRQARLVAQQWSGPARIRGPSGTGKSVVALHRAKRLAAEGKRVLVTSFVKTLPRVQEQLFSRLAPDHRERVEFRGLHSWACRLLDQRGVRLDLDGDPQTWFNLAWQRFGVTSALANLAVPPRYWFDEVQTVIKGRGITEYDAYAQLSRIGRSTALRPVHREAVWAIFQEYERIRRDLGRHDWADVLLLARDSLRAQPLEPGYDAVVADEVQDLTCVGAQLLYALAGDSPDGLLFVGDGQQAVYPGGFTLAEAGISVVGRAAVLDRNYRNGSQIIAAALGVVADDAYDDLESNRFAGTRDLEVDRDGGTVVTRPDSSGLVAQVGFDHARGVRHGDMAVLCPINSQAEQWIATLTRDGVPAIALTDYDGRPVDAVKVGTYQRAKGLEFAAVYLPDHRAVPAPQRSNESDDADAERAALERRQLFVAMAGLPKITGT